MDSGLKVYGRKASINVRKVLWCCEELTLTYQREDWGAGFRATDSKIFLSLNPNGLVPVIDDGGFILWQSNSIIRYLANSANAHRLYPVIPRQRARIDQWIDWQATELNDAWRGAFLGLVRKSPLHLDPRAIESSAAQWSRMMAILEDQLQTTDAYVCGSSFTLADIPLGLSVHRWYATPIPHPELAAVAAYYQRLKDRPSFAAQIDEA